MSGFLENQKKKQQDETSSVSSEAQSSKTDDESGEDEMAPEAAEDTSGPNQEEQSLIEALEKENQVLKERIQELEEGGAEQEGWMGPHEANALREENQRYQVKVINLQRKINQLQNQARLGKR